MSRKPIDKIFVTGQRAIDSMLTMGVGQRVGLMAGSGVGKSTLLGEIAKYASADLNVVAPIGERGREVLPFIKDSLGRGGLEAVGGRCLAGRRDASGTSSGGRDGSRDCGLVSLPWQSSPADV
jgi:hypothetical protein